MVRRHSTAELQPLFLLSWLADPLISSCHSNSLLPKVQLGEWRSRPRPGSASLSYFLSGSGTISQASADAVGRGAIEHELQESWDFPVLCMSVPGTFLTHISRNPENTHWMGLRPFLLQRHPR